MTSNIIRVNIFFYILFYKNVLRRFLSYFRLHSLSFFLSLSLWVLLRSATISNWKMVGNRLFYFKKFIFYSTRTFQECSFLTSSFILSLSVFCVALQRSIIENGRYLGSFNGTHFWVILDRDLIPDLIPTIRLVISTTHRGKNVFYFSL